MTKKYNLINSFNIKILLVFLAICLFLLYRLNKNNYNNPILLQGSLPTKVVTRNDQSTPFSDIKITEVDTSKKVEVKTDQLKTFWTNELLPGFSFWIPDGWSVVVKEFGRIDDSYGFRTLYFPECHKSCMGVKLTKGDVELEFIFNYILDDNATYCYDGGYLESLHLNNNWYQVPYYKDGPFSKNAKYVYTRNFHSEYVTSKDVHENSQVEKRSCIWGTMDLTIDNPNIKYPPFDQDGAVALEHPRLYGEPNDQILNEVWQIIVSISSNK